MNEAETRAERIDPLLAAAGWGVVEAKPDQQHIEGRVAEEQAAAGEIGEGFGVEGAAGDGDLQGGWAVLEAAHGVGGGVREGGGHENPHGGGGCRRGGGRGLATLLGSVVSCSTDGSGVDIRMLLTDMCRSDLLRHLAFQRNLPVRGLWFTERRRGLFGLGNLRHPRSKDLGFYGNLANQAIALS
jgi:hypothetical protein